MLGSFRVEEIRYLLKYRAIAIDPDYADAVFNLASLAFETGDLAAAGRSWARYVELDPDSDWGRTAARGVQFVALQTRGCADGNAG